jgi:hypothetical protein
MRVRLHLVAPVAAALAIGACADAGTPTSPSAAVAPTAAPVRGDRLATVELEGGAPALYIQNADGTGRVRVRFEHVSDHVIGNYSPRQLPVTDQTIRRIPRMKWSPDGRYLAVIVSPATEALQVVLVSADGRALRTVSPNGQYLWGDVEWSPDSRRIAYALATGPYGLGSELLVTDIGADKITQITTGARLSGYDTFRFDASGQRLLFTERLGWADDGINGLARISSVDLATRTVVQGETVIGEAQGFARDGSWGLFIRWAGQGQELFRRATDGTETVLASGDLANAVVLEGDEEAVLISADPADPSGATRAFDVIGLATPKDIRAKLPTAPSTIWAALSHAGS